MVDLELASQIYEEFLVIRKQLRECTIDSNKYKELVFKWVIKHHGDLETFRKAIELLCARRYCIPDSRLYISCPRLPCSKCHQEMPELLIKRINTPFR